LAANDIVVEYPTYEFTGASTTVPAAIEVASGADDCIVDKFKVIANASGLTITTAINIVASTSDRSRFVGRTVATLGTISAKMTNAGTDTYWEIQGA
jgi:hypothetical protein